MEIIGQYHMRVSHQNEAALRTIAKFDALQVDDQKSLGGGGFASHVRIN